MTLGQIRYELTKWAPGVDLALLDGWLYDRHQTILDALPWQRKQVQSVLQTAAVYDTGTVAVTLGNTAVTGTLTVWTAGMTGRCFRVVGRSEYYEFARTSDTTGTLDRAYEGATDAAAAYDIFQNVFLLPSDCMAVGDLRRISAPGNLTKLSLHELNEISPNRGAFGEPIYWAPFMDDASDPPRMQIELYPIPELAVGYPLVYWADTTPPSATSANVLPWLRPGALKAGVQADILAWQKDYAGAQFFEVKFLAVLAQMVQAEIQRRGPTALKPASWLTDHQRVRYDRSGGDDQ